MNASAFATAVRERAGQRCEYCRMHESLQGATFHVEHVMPSSRGGLSKLENLAWCCPSCNLYKSDRTQAIDPETNQPVPLFNPRRDNWDAHFTWLSYHLTGRTASARATIASLRLNSDRRLLIRRAEAKFALFPPA